MPRRNADIRTRDALRELADIDAVFRALAHARRRHILVVLRARGGRMTAGEIAARFSCAWPTTTRHLGVLLEAGLVTRTRDGKEMIYALDLARLEAVAGGWLSWMETQGGTHMTREKEFGNMVIALYRPHAGKETDLIELMRRHLPTLRRLKLATDREALVLKSSDGIFLEIFEWTSPEAVEQAHTHPEVAEVWEAFDKVCDHLATLSDLADAGRPFPHFQVVELS